MSIEAPTIHSLRGPSKAMPSMRDYRFRVSTLRCLGQGDDDAMKFDFIASVDTIPVRYKHADESGAGTDGSREGSW